jgi:hypothetical protein
VRRANGRVGGDQAQLERQRRVEEEREEGKEQHGRARNAGGGGVRERPGPSSERHAIDRCAGEAVENHQRAPPNRDLLSEEPEQRRQQLEGEGAGEARDVPIEPLAADHALRDVDDETFLEEIRLQRDHEGANRGAHQRPGQRHRLGRASGIACVHSPHSAGSTISEPLFPPSQE